MSGDGARRMVELITELEALLERVADAAATLELEPPPLPAGAPAAPAVTPWQSYAAELRSLCRRVLEEADEETAVAFWIFLIEMAARHGRRAGGRPS